MADDPLSDAAMVEAYRLGQMEDKADATLGVRFYYEDVEDAEATAKEGRPVFKQIECCEIKIPGEKETRCGRCKSMYPDPRKRFPTAYARFKAGAGEHGDGTLLKTWGIITSARAREYAAFNVFTVEQLAALSDANCQKIAGSIADRQKARDFIEFAKGQAPTAQLRSELQKRDNEIQSLRDQLKDLAKQMKKG